MLGIVVAVPAGAALGLAGLIQKRRARHVAVIGFVLNALLLLGFGSLILLAALLPDPG